MNFYIAEHSGFCVGVKNAVETAKKIGEKDVYILGELIHNKLVTDEILLSGTKIIDGVDEVENGTVIIRSHGVGKDVYEKLQSKKNVKIVDCTCPFVKKIHNIVEKYHNDGYTIIIIGEKNHPETIGVNGWCDYKAVFLDDEDELFDFNRFEKVCIVCQTTFDREKFENILKYFKKKYNKTVEIFDTICYTTKVNQQEACSLSQKCDAMVVIGGKNSSNTAKLYDVCKTKNDNVFYISSALELDVKGLLKFKNIGIVCGASTPREQAMEVILRMDTEAKKTTETLTMEDAVANIGEQTRFRRGMKIEATISSATDEGLQVLLPNTKKEVLLKKEELDCDVYDKANYASKVGDEIEVLIVGLNPVVISEKEIKRLAEEEKEIAEIGAGKIFNVVIDGFNKGGLTAKYGSYSVFIPASQIKLNGFAKDLEKYVGKTLRVKAEEGKIENKPRRKQIVASQKIVLQEEKVIKDKEKEEKENQFFDSIAVDEILTGKVVRFAPFGAFVNVNGFDCLAHVSDLSWTSVKNPDEVLELDKEYDFVVLKIDRENKKVSIGYKQLQPKPWDSVPEKYAVGDVITGKVVRIVPFGAFVEVEKGIDGLVHVSQITHEWLEDATTVLKVGQEVQAKIININLEKEKMTLSIKDVLPAPEKTEEEKEETSDKPAKARKSRKVKEEDSDELRNWNEDKEGGASIFEIINKDNQ